jgi:hypothetical protein
LGLDRYSSVGAVAQFAGQSEVANGRRKRPKKSPIGSIASKATVALQDDEAARAKNFQVLRDARDRELGRGGEISRRLRRVAAVAHDAAPLGVRERSEDIVETIVRQVFGRSVQP